MELSITFETNHIRMQELWLHMTDAFLHFDPDVIPQKAWLNPSVVTTLTLFSPYQEECKTHLMQAIASVVKGNLYALGEAAYFLPRCIIRYHTHTGVLLLPQQMLDAFSAAYQQDGTALSLGAYLDVQRLRTLYGISTDPNEISEQLRAYKAEQKVNRDGIAVDLDGNPLLYDNLYATYFDFVSDDFRFEVGRYIALSSFAVPLGDKHILYDALTGLEAYDALFASILETGGASENIEELAAFYMGLVCGLCGVNFEALSRGRYQATPHTPFDMSYTLLIPYQRGVMVFSGGEAQDEVF